MDMEIFDKNARSGLIVRLSRWFTGIFLAFEPAFIGAVGRMVKGAQNPCFTRLFRYFTLDNMGKSMFPYIRAERYSRSSL
jgi:hypothetical protein